MATPKSPNTTLTTETFLYEVRSRKFKQKRNGTSQRTRRRDERRRVK